MSREAGKPRNPGWIPGRSPMRGARARGPKRTPLRAACLRLVLFLVLATALVSARARTPSSGARAYVARIRASGPDFLPLAEQCDPRAQTYLGVMYLRGRGVPQNFLVAAYWLHLAAGAGFPEAQYFLGLMYDKGQGMPQDFVLAHAWLNLAVAHAQPRVRGRWLLIRDAVASKMTEAQLSEARKLAYDGVPTPLS